MSVGKKCPDCGTELAEDAPQGLCPKCLMANMMETDEASPSDMPTKLSYPDTPVPSSVDVGAVDGEVSAAPEPTGKYSVLGQYGKGGMGRVLLVHDEHLGRDVALKELLPDMSEGDTPTPAKHSKEMASRFLREAKITGQLEHPSITPVHELGRRDDGTLYYTMKLVKGRTLQAAIRESNTMEERLKLLPHFVDLCNAIAYAHSRGVIHRDIKPANVMVGDYGETVILDWGLAKVKGAPKSEKKVDPAAETLVGIKADSGGGSDAAKTQYGQTLGTPAYMPPEQAAGDLDHIDERSDVYSLGAVLYEFLTGHPPHTGKSVEGILHAISERKPRPVTDYVNDAADELVAVVSKALEKDPESRYQSAKDLASDIERFQSGALVQAHHYGPREYAAYLWTRYKTSIIASAAILTLIIGFIAAFTYNTFLNQQRERQLRIAAEHAQVNAVNAEAEARRSAEEASKALGEAEQARRMAERRAEETEIALNWGELSHSVRVEDEFRTQVFLSVAYIKDGDELRPSKELTEGLVYGLENTGRFNVFRPHGDSQNELFESPEAESDTGELRMRHIKLAASLPEDESSIIEYVVFVVAELRSPGKPHPDPEAEIVAGGSLNLFNYDTLALYRAAQAGDSPSGFGSNPVVSTGSNSILLSEQAFVTGGDWSVEFTYGEWMARHLMKFSKLSIVRLDEVAGDVVTVREKAHMKIGILESLADLRIRPTNEFLPLDDYSMSLKSRMLLARGAAILTRRKNAYGTRVYIDESVSYTLSNELKNLAPGTFAISYGTIPMFLDGLSGR